MDLKRLYYWYDYVNQEVVSWPLNRYPEINKPKIQYKSDLMLNYFTCKMSVDDICETIYDIPLNQVADKEKNLIICKNKATLVKTICVPRTTGTPLVPDTKWRVWLGQITEGKLIVIPDLDDTNKDLNSVMQDMCNYQYYKITVETNNVELCHGIGIDYDKHFFNATYQIKNVKVIKND